MTPQEQKALQTLSLSLDTHTYRQGYDRYRYLAKKHHPDKGGDAEMFKQIQNAWEIAKRVLSESVLPIAMLFHDERNLYLRWVTIWYMGKTTDYVEYKDWLHYRKVGDTYTCYGDLKSDIPKSEQRLEHNKTHCVQRKVLDNLTMKELRSIKPLKVKEINPNEFVVI